MRKVETPLNPQVFPDGLAVFYQQRNIAEKGNRPVYEATELIRVPYEEKKVGDIRYYAAMQADSTISKVIRIPRVSGIQPSGDIVMLSGDESQYRVQKTVRNAQTYPESIDVTLEISKHVYSLKEAADDTD